MSKSSNFKGIVSRLAVVVVLGGAAALSSVVVGAADRNTELFPEKILATGKGVKVTDRQLDEAFIAFKANTAARGGALPEGQRETIEARLLDRLVVTQILLQRATDPDRVRAKEASDKLVRSAKEKFESEEIFVQQLRANGLALEEFNRRLLEQAICEVVLERELKSKQEVSEEEAKKFYQEKPDRFQQPDRVRVSHILLATVDRETRKPLPEATRSSKRQLIEKLRQRAQAGEDFVKLVQEFSEDPANKENKGEYTFARNQGMAKPFEVAAFSLKTNQVSDVVETAFGYHVIKLHEKLSPRQVPYDEVKPQLREALMQQKFEKELPVYLERLKKEYAVQITGVPKSGGK